MTQSLDQPYLKGFLLSKQSFPSVAHFTERKLSGGWNFWSDDATETSFSENSEDDFVLIRGHWADTSDAAGGVVAADLLGSRERSESAFEEHLGRVNGRYVVILSFRGEVHVYNDAVGLRSVYYSLTSDLICSHVNLLLELEPHEQVLSVKVANRAMDATAFAQVRQLLPNFRLAPNSREIYRFYPVQENRFMSWSREQRLARVEELWSRTLSKYTAGDWRIAISVTGGLDSRLMLAMSKPHWESFASYTYGVAESDNTRHAEALHLDFKLVHELLPLLEMKSHDFIDWEKLSEPSSELAQLIQRNTIGDHGKRLVSAYRNLFPHSNWLHLRGTGVEIIRRYWKVKDHSFEGILRYLTYQDSPNLRERGVSLGYNEPHIHGFHPLDLAYWEIRMGKWHAEILNEQDAAFETFLPIASREILELLLSFSHRERADADAVYELINRNAPTLNFIGVNNPKNLYEQMHEHHESLRQATFSDFRLGVKADAEPIYLAEDDILKLPSSDFETPNAISAALFTSPDFGDLSFRIIRANTATHQLRWQLHVGGVLHMECDGGNAAPAHVTLRHLRPGAEVRLSVTRGTLANKGVRDLAHQSVTHVDQLRFSATPGSTKTATRVYTDCESARFHGPGSLGLSRPELEARASEADTLHESLQSANDHLSTTAERLERTAARLDALANSFLGRLQRKYWRLRNSRRG